MPRAPSGVYLLRLFAVATMLGLPAVLVACSTLRDDPAAVRRPSMKRQVMPTNDGTAADQPTTPGSTDSPDHDDVRSDDRFQAAVRARLAELLRARGESHGTFEGGN